MPPAMRTDCVNALERVWQGIMGPDFIVENQNVNFRFSPYIEMTGKTYSLSIDFNEGQQLETAAEFSFYRRSDHTPFAITESS
jgi:hypothetical protein